ncbi:MAG: hypothetical protein E6I39_05960 [Chloroflexi bacterium]|nr:MAG: hypothetical protein E6I98_07395 [Chloroflexota bacterium]TMF00258.1 MAG: hypothetical protein E6I39_05960 [Chloroflexota bacterium]
MSPTAYFERPSDSLATARGARVRRLLLEQVRYALTTEPAALEIAPDVAPGSLTYIRGRVSITVGAIVVRLNQEGFTGSERLYEMRDGLAQGRPVGRGDLEWLNTIIATERGLQTGS